MRSNILDMLVYEKRAYIPDIGVKHFSSFESNCFEKQKFKSDMELQIRMHNEFEQAHNFDMFSICHFPCLL